MSTVTTTQVGNLRITTHVVQTADTSNMTSNVTQPAICLTPLASKHFKKTPVRALSALLMLIGILQLFIGILYYAAETTIVSLTLNSGVYIWGGLAVFVAGGACLTAILKDTLPTVKVCMVFNVVNIVVGVVGLILFIIQIYYESQATWKYADLEESIHDSYNPYYYGYNSCMVMNLRLSLLIIVILFSLLGLAISGFMTIVSFKAMRRCGYSMLR
ncbi:uncharacterized protein [Pyxicephalus adspersus]